MRVVVLMLAALFGVGCSWSWEAFSQTTDSGSDGGISDSGSTDASTHDGGEPDGAIQDGGDPTPLDAGLPRCAVVRSFDVGAKHSCIVLDGGVLRCRGDNTTGALGVGTSDEYEGFAPAVAGGPWRGVSVGSSSTCAIDADDRLFCWGDTPERLGVTASDTTVPQRVDVAAGVRVESVARGARHGCLVARGSPTTIQCFGDNGFGQAFGDGLIVTPARHVGSGLSVVTGIEHSCRVALNGYTACWGRNNNHAQLAADRVAVPSSRTLLTVETNRVSQLSTGDYFTCAITDSATVICWGDSRNGQCGAPIDTSSIATPLTRLTLPDAVVPIQIDAGGQHACFTSNTGEIWCWGANNVGQLGLGDLAGTSSRTRPERAATGFVEVRAGGNATCARTMDGELWCWGDGDRAPRRVCVPD